MVRDSLVDARSLSVKSDGCYALSRDGEMSTAWHELRRLPRVAGANRAAALRNEERCVIMAWAPVFYSVNETSRPPLNRVHHNNSVCPPGRDRPLNERRTGTGGYWLCDDCDRLNKQGR